MDKIGKARTSKLALHRALKQQMKIQNDISSKVPLDEACCLQDLYWIDDIMHKTGKSFLVVDQVFLIHLYYDKLIPNILFCIIVFSFPYII